MIGEPSEASYEPHCDGEDPGLSSEVLQKSFWDRVDHLRQAFSHRAGDHHLVASFVEHATGKTHNIPVDKVAFKEGDVPGILEIPFSVDNTVFEQEEKPPERKMTTHKDLKKAAVLFVSAGAIAAAVIVVRRKDRS